MVHWGLSCNAGCSPYRSCLRVRPVRFRLFPTARRRPHTTPVLGDCL
jgi:hypothetical protein